MPLKHDSSRRKEQIPKIRQNGVKADFMNDGAKQVCFFSFKKTENEKQTNQKTVQESHNPGRKQT